MNENIDALSKLKNIFVYARHDSSMWKNMISGCEYDEGKCMAIGVWRGIMIADSEVAGKYRAVAAAFTLLQKSM